MALAAQRAERGEAYVLLTVVRVQRPTSGKPGDKALLTQTGEWFGWVGGSCAEPSAKKMAKAALASGEASLLRLTNDVEAEASSGVEVLPMTCFSGGALDIFIEPVKPPTCLYVLGRSPVAQALARLGEAMRYRVHHTDVIPTPLATTDSAEGMDGELRRWPEVPPPGAVVVVASHGRQEKAALRWALSSSTRYVGLVASRRRCSAVRQSLSESGVSAEALDALDSPAGLDIGGRGPEEVALSILAAVVQHHRQSAEGKPRAT